MYPILTRLAVVLLVLLVLLLFFLVEVMCLPPLLLKLLQPAPEMVRLQMSEGLLRLSVLLVLPLVEQMCLEQILPVLEQMVEEQMFQEQHVLLPVEMSEPPEQEQRLQEPGDNSPEALSVA